MTLGMLLAQAAEEAADNGVNAGKAIALALGIGLGSVGAGIGVGTIFGSMIQAVARQPELRGELTGIQWLGFALVGAGVFSALLRWPLGYGLVLCPARPFLSCPWELPGGVGASTRAVR